MPIDPKFPSDPFAIISPDHRWHPARDAGGMILAEADPRFGSLLPPLADKIRRGVAKWRESGYAGASATSRGLLEWWFQRPHIGAYGEEFRYYFAQREAVESAIWLHDVERVRDGLGLARYDSFGEIRTGELSEDWPRFVVKMATGSGKDEGDVAAGGVVVFPQTLRGGVGVGAEHSADCAEHYCFGPSAAGL